MQANRKESANLARDHAWVLGAQLGYSALRFLAITLLARMLSTEEMGRVMFAMNYTLVFIFLGTLGLDSTYIHFAAKFQAQGATIQLGGMLRNAIKVALVWGTLQSVLGITIALMSFRSVATLEIFAFLISVPFALVTMYGLGALLGLRDLSSYAALFIMQPVSLMLLLVILAGIGEFNMLTVALSFLITYIATSATVVWRLVRHVPGLFAFRHAQSKDLREQLGFSIFVYMHMIGLFLDSRWPILLMGWLNQAQQIAYYSISTPITEASLQLARSASLVLLARSSARDLPSSAITTRIWLLYIPAMALLMGVAPRAVPWLFGSEYMTAVPLIQVLAPGMIPLAAGILQANLRIGLGQPQIGAYGALISLGAMITLSTALIPRYGAMGGAIATVLAYLLYWGSVAVLSWRTR